MGRSAGYGIEQIELKVPQEVAERNKSASLASHLVYLAIKAHLADHPGDLPSWLIDNPVLSEAHIVDLDHGDVDLNELGHRQGSGRLLELLADRFRYPEAILTLGKRYYTNSEISADEFALFLQRHQDNEWLIRSLARDDPSSQEKYLVYNGIVTKYPHIQDDVILIQSSHQQQKEACLATTESEIRRLYDMGDSAVLRALAANPHTPDDLLRLMELLHGVKFAREIRNMASNTLARKRNK